MAKKKGLQDITRLAGLIFLKRGFAEAAAKDPQVFLAECVYGDLTKKQQATFEAALHNPTLKQAVKAWWKKYDAARAAGEVPKASPWYD